ncbi:MAG: L,D-transpeptidase [Candidatus Moraniibacteriota bacterium]
MQNKYKIIINYIKKQYKIFSLRKKLFVFAIIAAPITSTGVGMTLYIDNSAEIIQSPIFESEPVLNLDELLTIRFKESISDSQKYESMISTYPSSTLSFFWNTDNTMLKIIPKTIWKPATTYSISFPYNSYEYTTEKSILFSFTTVPYPSVLKTSIDNSNNSYATVNSSIDILLDKEIDKFNIQVVTRPFIKTEQNYNPTNKILSIKILDLNPAENFKTSHSLTVFANHKRQSKASFYPIYSSTFNTILEKPSSWPTAHAERLTLSQSTTAPKIKKGKYIDINTEAQITTLFENGEGVKSFVNSTGADDTPTPLGEFEIYNKHPYALSNMFQVYLPYWMAFTEDGLYGFHDLIVWPEGHEDKPEGGKESLTSIGNAVSPGCVRHDAQNSQFIYDWTDVGTKVVIY